METLVDESSRPSISLAIAVRDGAHFVEQALAGVEAQTQPPDQIVLVDDGSEDATLEKLNEVRRLAPDVVQVISQPRRGLAAARNSALKATNCTWQIILDADDVPQPDLLQRMAAFVERHPQTALAFCRVRYVDKSLNPKGLVSPWPGERLAFTDFLHANPMHSTSGTIIDRRKALAAGGFDENLTAMADVDMAIRLGQAGGQLCAVNEVLLNYRKHKTQVTTDWRRLSENWERVFEKARAAMPEIVAPIETVARAENAVFWATTAYQAEDFSNARRLMRQAWRGAPKTLIRNRHALIRTLACLATRLPRPLHDMLQRGAGRVGGARG